MGKIHNNSTLKYLLVLCLSAVLLLAQTDKFHMHLEHDDRSGLSTHVFAVHPESTRHDFTLSNHHDSHFADHSSDAVNVSPDTLMKKTNFLNLLLVIVFFTGFLLCIPRRTSVSRQRFYKILIPTCYYLFQPPLRAPPVT